jgi:hypothetical protein
MGVADLRATSGVSTMQPCVRINLLARLLKSPAGITCALFFVVAALEGTVHIVPHPQMVEV